MQKVWAVSKCINCRRFRICAAIIAITLPIISFAGGHDGSSAASPEPEVTRYLIRNVSVWDGTSDRAVPGQSVLPSDIDSLEDLGELDTGDQPGGRVIAYALPEA